jgi:hypothetical protein
MTKFGRSFSIVRIPYCLKLLMQELLVMNVQMRIITEDNIDQLPSMSYSKNVYKVLKDGKGAMGVDDIIERNRLAAGLKPRPAAGSQMPSASASASASDSAGFGDAAHEEETANGSRVYLPSRSEQEEEEDTRPRYLASDIVKGSKNRQDPDEHPEEIIQDLDVDTRQTIRNLGWRFAVKESIRREKSFNLADVTSEDLVLESVILDKNGEPTERWTISGRQWVGDYPTRFPDGWLSEMLLYPDDTPISPSDMVEELRANRKPMNWVLSIISLMEKRGRRKLAQRTQAEGLMADENIRNIEANTKETARVSSEIERAKREGNVAEEERLKVQMTRLMDERAKLDSTRREIEQQEIAAANYVPQSPKYTSSTPVGEEEEEEAERVRRAVESFNVKMLEKYGETDENIPESEGFTPRTPSSPAYSSLFEGGAQRGGQRGGKFIPQIPSMVLENYLHSKYGVSPKHITETRTPMSGMMMGGGGGVAGIPTMNIPVVATMPMAGMMPIQQQQPQPQQGQQGQQGGGLQQGQQGGANQSGGASTNQPNEQGVRTFSITPFK